jgi:hypothetical protein
MHRRLSSGLRYSVWRYSDTITTTGEVSTGVLRVISQIEAILLDALKEGIDQDELAAIHAKGNRN